MLASVGRTAGHGYAGSVREAVVGGGCFGNFSPYSLANAKLDGSGGIFLGGECRPRHEGYRKFSKHELRKSLISNHVSEDDRIRSLSWAVQCSSNVQSLQMEISRSKQLQQYLDNIYSAMGLQNYYPRQHITVTGLFPSQFPLRQPGPTQNYNSSPEYAGLTACEWQGV